MGFRLKKSFNLGAGFRINLSKSGIGYSWGIPGFRKTKLCNGRSRSTCNIPGTGISYITEKSPTNNSVIRNTTAQQKHINTEIDQISANEDSLITDLNLCRHNRFLIKFYVLLSVTLCSLLVFSLTSSLWLEKTVLAIIGTVLLWRIIPINKISLLCFHVLVPLLICTLVTNNATEFSESEQGDLIVTVILSSICLCIITKLCEKRLQRKYAESVKIIYDWDDDYQMLYTHIEHLVKLINSNRKIWHITSITGQCWKRGIFIPQNFEGTPVKFEQGLPNFLECNIRIYHITIEETTLYLLPDKCLCVTPNKIFSLRYNDIECNIGSINITEPQRRINDACIVAKNWLHSNKDGERDYRYHNNYYYPIYQYGTVSIAINNKDILFYCSNVEKTKELASQLSEITMWAQKTLSTKIYSVMDAEDTTSSETNRQITAQNIEVDCVAQNEPPETITKNTKLKAESDFDFFYESSLRHLKIKQYTDLRVELFEMNSDGSYQEVKNKTMTILSTFIKKYITSKPTNTRHAVDLFLKFIKTPKGKEALSQWNKQHDKD